MGMPQVWTRRTKHGWDYRYSAPPINTRELGWMPLYCNATDPDLQKLGKRLSELLDEHQWIECENMLLAAGVMPPKQEQP